MDIDQELAEVDRVMDRKKVLGALRELVRTDGFDFLMADLEERRSAQIEIAIDPEKSEVTRLAACIRQHEIKSLMRHVGSKIETLDKAEREHMRERGL